MRESDKLKQELYSLINAGRAPHASIFIGKIGFGTLDIVLDFAQALLCTDSDEVGTPCTNCTACHKAKKLIHPDLHFAFPVIKKGTKKRADTTSKDFLAEWREIVNETHYFNLEDWAGKIQADNKQLNINTTECNEIIKKLGLKAFEGGNKVMIIYLAEYLGREGNRLLKLIEEPPPNTFIILIAENQESILNTILSRCQIFGVSPMRDDRIKSELQTLSIEEEQQDFISFLANGDLRRALILAQNNSMDLSADVITWLRHAYLLNKKPKVLIEWVDDFSKLSKMAQNSFLEYVLHFLREFQLSLFDNQSKLRLSKEEIDSVEKLKNIIDFEKVEKLSQICDTLYYNLSRNVNSKIELMNASIDINNLLHKKVVLST